MKNKEDLLRELHYIKNEIDAAKSFVNNMVYLMGRLEVVMEDIRVETQRQGDNGYVQAEEEGDPGEDS